MKSPTNIPVLISGVRTGSRFLSSVLRYYRLDPYWNIITSDYDDDTRKSYYQQVILRQTIPVCGHIDDKCKSGLRYHFEIYPDSKLIVLLRIDTLRQAFSHWRMQKLKKLDDTQSRIDYESRYDTIKMPQLTEEDVAWILSQQSDMNQRTEFLLSVLEEMDIPHMTLFYEYDLLGKGECCLEGLIGRLCRFWDIPLQPSINKTFEEVIQYRLTNIKTEVTYRKLQEMVKERI